MLANPEWKPASAREQDRSIADENWWKALTEKANAAYAQGDRFSARLFYGEALLTAGGLFQSALEGRHEGQVPVAMIYVISCHNLAELELQCGNGPAARVHFCRACERLIEGAGNAHAPVAVRAGCMQHLKPALASLVSHYQSCGEPEGTVTDLLNAARKAVMSAFHAVRHADLARRACGHCRIALN
ncbi:hypothetical protein ACT6QG_13110 [Xanthobacter sp. TB0136]|uniref:hypothetical protein n=1 Tax=Xanthobacter sp. TB0136 TaxID=3459177 RepID=UPI0040391C6B